MDADVVNAQKIKKRLKDIIRESTRPCPGWRHIVKQFTPKKGDILLIQYAQGHEPDHESLEDMANDLCENGIDINILVLPGDLSVQHIPSHKVWELLDALIDLAERAMGAERYKKGTMDHEKEQQ